MPARAMPDAVRTAAAASAGVGPAKRAPVRFAPTTLRGSLRLSLLYLAVAHIALIAACALFIAHGARWPHFYHPQVVAVLHLVTLGWITGSILGMCYLLAPLALRVSHAATRWDHAAGVAFAIGVPGMVAAAWRGRYAGLAAASILVLAAIARVGWYVIEGLRDSDIADGVKLHVRLAFFNMLLAGLLGALMGIDREQHIWNVPPMAQTWAHAHLAAIGWGIMLVFGLSYRLLPMMIPAAMPSGHRLKRTARWLEAGTLAIVAGHLLGITWIVFAGALAIGGGIRAFVREVRAIAAHRLPPPAGRPAADPARRLAHACTSWLMLAFVLGLLLVWLPASRATLALAWVYGVSGLIGYLSQLVVGMGGRLFPMLAWYAGMAERGHPPACAVHELIVPRIAQAVTHSWMAGVPLIAAGLALRHLWPVLIWLTMAGCASLLVGVLLNGLHLWIMRRRALALAAPTAGARPSSDQRGGSNAQSGSDAKALPVIA